MEDVGDPQAVLLGKLGHAVENLRQSAARNGAIHAVIVRRDSPDSRERRLAPGPETLALGLGIGDAERDGASRLGNDAHPLDQFVDLGLGAVEFDNQQRLDVQRVAGVDERFGRVDGRTVHHLHTARNDAGADDLCDAIAGGLVRGEADQQCARGGGFGQDAHRHLGNDAEQALGPADDAH